MKMRIEVVSVDADGSEQRRQVLAVERQELAMETLGMSLAESKSLLEGVQDSMIAQQVGEDLERRRPCFHCGRLHIAKDSGTAPVRTLFGPVNVQNPRWRRCACRTEGPKTFRPTHAWLQGRTSVEMLYLESKWASLIPFAKVADLLKEVLPVGGSVNSETVRTHMQATAERIEQALGEERQLNEYEGSEKEWEEQPLPDGPITVGIDGGYVRAAHKQGCFEVIAGKSVVSFRREDATEVPSAKCFGFVQIYDEKPRRRLWELLKSQGMQENQQVIFMSDGGEDVRRVQQYLHPFSEHLLDWFHITMRLTVLQQQTKGLQQERPAAGADAGKQLESIKHFLWHGNTPEALDRLTSLSISLDMIREHSVPAAKVANGVADFEIYIKNNSEFIPNFGDRWRQGERISTAFVESTINQVVSRRFVKKQQMQWTLRGAHLLLQTRTKVLNDELEGTFRKWYPRFRPQAA
ncbi:MAG TPA: ISKra4 family transposase [Candidatus Sulfotelmatobacter sp.]